MDNSTTPQEMFTGIRTTANMNHQHVFGCPIYAATSQVANGFKAPKWETRSRLGINLGFSPCHANNVYLFLNPITGLVSPQFHVKHDDSFITVEGEDSSNSVSQTWKILAGFRGSKNSSFWPTNNIRHTDKTHQESTEPTEYINTNTNSSTQDSTTREGRPSRTPAPRELLTYNKDNVQTSVRTDSFINTIRTPNLYSLSVSSNPDIMYLYEARKENDWPSFQKAMGEDVRVHNESK